MYKTESEFFDVINAKVIAGLEVSDTEIQLALAYVMDTVAIKNGCAEANTLINKIKQNQ